MGGRAALQGISRVIGGGATATHRLGAAIYSAAHYQGKNSIATSEKITVSSSSSTEPTFQFSPEQEKVINEGYEQGFQTLPNEHHHVSDRLVFGILPTQQHVLEDTSDLQDAHKQNTALVSSTVGHESVSSLFESVYEKPDSVEVSNMQEIMGSSYENLVNQVDSVLYQDNDKVMPKSGYCNALEAFNLLQSNPAIQGVVASLALDKAVRDAMMKNEKVQEFRQLLLKGESDVSNENKAADKPPHDHKNPFTEAIENMKVKMMGFKEKITEVCNQFLGFADTVFLKKDGDFVERTIKISSMLGIILLLIGLGKRV
ncbi:hypothetical protein SUGI_0656900 [Cryptomeria japonica]|uniref:uncharacterized protein LOC131048628 isoform X2 n=1 Tax=Cryptomeria japonica TaxID=3369 RepID=UPI0024146FCE|nr:uncharacterized protein LOC131048628 isoform X2 [Cryptomeria japonica]GLJ32650.1 hypothetical protein SUGI_0656900 [Cryptomeria japonica]